MDVNINSAIDGLEVMIGETDSIADVIKQNIDEGGVLQLLGLIQNRIQLTGRDANGDLIGNGQYSTTEQYFDVSQFRLPSNFPGPRSPTRKPKNPNKKGPNETARISYEDLRELNNLQTDWIDLSYTYPDTEALWNSIDVECTVEDKHTFKIVLSARNTETEGKMAGLESRYGIKILELSDDEIADIQAYLESLIIGFSGGLVQII